MKRPIGQILIDGEFISPSDLEAALERQRDNNELLGNILVGMGVLDHADLKAVLALQKNLTSAEEAAKVAAGVRVQVGNLLIGAKRITHEQLDSALSEQKKTGEKLGKILVRLGMVEASEIEAILAFQQNQGEASSSPLRLGEILVAAEYITREQLENSLLRQKSTGKKLGEVLVDEGYAQPHQITHGLRIQQKLLASALVALLSFSGMGLVPELVGLITGKKIVVSTTVLPRATLKVISQPQKLVVTKADISRGYVEVKSAVRLEVKNNSRAGYLLVFEGKGMQFKEVYVQGLGSDVRITQGGGWIPQPYIPKISELDLSFKFILTEESKPGTYEWPLEISVRPL
jgi:hypothetical protein